MSITVDLTDEYILAVEKEADRRWRAQVDSYPSRVTIALELLRDGWKPEDPVLEKAREICAEEFHGGDFWRVVSLTADDSRVNTLNVVYRALQIGQQMAREGK